MLWRGATTKRTPAANRHATLRWEQVAAGRDGLLLQGHHTGSPRTPVAPSTCRLTAIVRQLGACPRLALHLALGGTTTFVACQAPPPPGSTDRQRPRPPRAMATQLRIATHCCCWCWSLPPVRGGSTL